MKTGRNDPCPCGSGRKYKKCCMGKDQGMPMREKLLIGLIATAAVVAVGAVLVTTLRHGGSSEGGDGMVWSAEHQHWHRQ